MPSANRKRAVFLSSLVLFFAAFLSTLAVAQYKRVDLVSDQTGMARHTDPNLSETPVIVNNPGNLFGTLVRDTGESEPTRQR